MRGIERKRCKRKILREIAKKLYFFLRAKLWKLEKKKEQEATKKKKSFQEVKRQENKWWQLAKLHQILLKRDAFKIILHGYPLHLNRIPSPRRNPSLQSFTLGIPSPPPSIHKTVFIIFSLEFIV